MLLQVERWAAMNVSLEGTRILVIEDDSFSAAMAEEMLSELGCHSIVKAVSVDEASCAIGAKGPFDCVILDVRLGRELSSGIATRLMKEKVPFIVCSGYDIQLPGMSIPVVDKPYTVETLGWALQVALSKAKVHSF
jgi:CheY-like chemotaxis protein